MTTFAKLALAALLASGAGTMMVAPAAAKEKKKEEAGPKLSPEFIKAAQPAQNALNANDLAAAEPAIGVAEAAAQTDDDKYVAATFRYNLAVRKLQAAQTANPNAPLDETSLAAPLDALIASPKTAAADRGKFLVSRGRLAYNSKQYAPAIQMWQQAKQLGAGDANLDLQIVRAKMELGDVAGASTDLRAYMKAQTAAGTKPDEELYRYAIAKTNQKKMAPETIAWLREYAMAYPTAKNWRDVIVTYGMTQSSVVTTDRSQRVDLYRLMRASKSLADQYDYEDYAQKVFDMGLPNETKAVITEGKNAGKIPANSELANGLLANANQSIRNEGSLVPLAASAQKAASGKPAAQTADAYLGNGEYGKAVELYRVALQKGGVNADEVNTRLGIALAMSGDKAGATTAFAAVTSQPRAGIAELWTAWVGTAA